MTSALHLVPQPEIPGCPTQGVEPVCPGLFRKGGVYYLRRALDGVRVVRSLNTRSERVALLQLEEFDSDPHGWLERRGLRARQTTSLASAVGAWQADAAGVRRLSSSRLGAMRVVATSMLAALGEKTTISRVRAADVERWAASYGEGRHPATLAKDLKIAKEFWAWAAERRIVLRSPARTLSLPRPEPTDEDPTRVVALADIRALGLLPHHERTMIALWGTGLRLGELEALRLGDIDVPGQKIRIRKSKTKRARSVPVSDPELMAMLLDVVREGLPTRTPLHKALAAAFRRHPEIPPFTPKAMRHSRASLWVNSRLPLQTVAAWLGHTVSELERTYLHPVHHGLTPPPSGLGSPLVGE